MLVIQHLRSMFINQEVYSGNVPLCLFVVPLIINCCMYSYLATQDVPIIANCLLFNAHIGIGLYLYSRLHISSHSSNLCITKQIIYSIYGAVLFNFGSILLWATTSSIIPTESVLARTFIAISSSVALLLIGHEYMSYIDYRCRDRDKSSVDASDEEEDADDESDIHYHNFS